MNNRIIKLKLKKQLKKFKKYHFMIVNKSNKFKKKIKMKIEWNSKINRQMKMKMTNKINKKIKMKKLLQEKQLNNFIYHFRLNHLLEF